MDDVSHLLLLLVSSNCEVTTKEDGEDKGGVEYLFRFSIQGFMSWLKDNAD